MLNPEEFKLFLQANCLLCKKFKGTSDDNCGTYKKIEISQYINGSLFPLKDLKPVPQVSKYICKKLEPKVEVKKVVKVIDKVDQLKMF